MSSQEIVGRIVQEMFNKAKNETTSRSRYGLSKHIADEIEKINYRTLERAYDRYIKGNLKEVEAQDESVLLFCNYLGYENYGEYVEKNKIPINKGRSTTGDPPPITKSPKKYYLEITIGIIISIFLAIFIIYKVNNVGNMQNMSSKCMAWVETSYKEISCDIEFHPDSGTKTELYDPKRFKGFRKVEVTILTKFFSEDTKKPLIWYYKNRNDEIEYFTSSGIHPTNGETLKKITPYIINTYVPKHTLKPNSFIDNDTENKQ
ncbi:hypothetical protein ACWGOQ_0006045 [Aquimarina sp. M1]